jgi:hypothetical protein
MSQLLQDYYTFAQGEKEKISNSQSILKLSET